jgi:hypothetical protein
MTETTHVDLLRAAVENGASYETIVKLAELQERAKTRDAVELFNSAMATAKGSIGPILKDMEGGQGRDTYMYASMAQVARAVDPQITPLGLSYRFRSSQIGTSVTMTCVTTHMNGHSEETSLTGDVEHSDRLTPMQCLSAAVSMLQRLTLMAAFGLSAYQDTDCQRHVAAPADNAVITDERYFELERLAEVVGADMSKLLRFISTSIGKKIDRLEDLPASEFERAKGLLESKRKA